MKYKLYFYDMGGKLRAEEIKKKAIAIALAKQAIGKAWVEDDKGEIVYEKPADIKLDKPEKT